jgi:hypothetical protein
MKNITKVLKLFFLNLILKFTIKIFYKFWFYFTSI